MPLFVVEKAKWVEYERIPDGKHPLDLHPTHKVEKKWWRYRCENCGRWHHLASMCDQVHVQLVCSLCGLYIHEAHECNRFRHAFIKKREYGIWQDENGDIITVPNWPADNHSGIYDLEETVQSDQHSEHSTKSAQPLEVKQKEFEVEPATPQQLAPESIQAYIQKEMMKFFAQHQLQTSHTATPQTPVTPMQAQMPSTSSSHHETKSIGIKPSPIKLATLSLGAQSTQSMQSTSRGAKPKYTATVTDADTSDESGGEDCFIGKIDALHAEIEKLAKQRKLKYGSNIKRPNRNSHSQTRDRIHRQSRRTREENNQED
jgi:hypothetical protein